MKAYLSFIKLRLGVGLQYRFAAIAGIATQFFFGAMYVMMYDAYYRSGVSTGMEWQQLVSYVWIQQAFFYLTYFNLMDPDIYDSIVTGQVSYEFIRPINVYWLWYAKLFAKKIAGAALRFLPVILIASLLPVHYSLKGPASPESFLLFVITLTLGVLLSLGIGMLIYSLMFYTTSSKGIFSVYTVIAEFFAGGVIPIPFMPEILQKICYLLPFRLSVDLPYRLYAGNISIEEGIQSALVQLIWIFIVIAAGRIILKNASKKLVVQGG
ncbi:MAG: ABC-2 family transporter protein [Clostridia bacterium]|nr:ABC-2 family transporter protein [Clostridia bacterium]